MTLVKSLNNTSDNTCKCKSWLDHWNKFNKNPRLFCSANGCNSPCEVGAHVIKVDSADNNWYIVPVCKKHNAPNIEFNTDAKLAPANIQTTCG